jgi:hypothetical protein
MIQCGARKGVPPDARNTFQSSRVAGAKSFVPSGQLILSAVFLTSQQFVHFKMAFAEYAPLSVSFSHLQLEGLPSLGFVLMTSLHGGGVVRMGFFALKAVWQ